MLLLGVVLKHLFWNFLSKGAPSNVALFPIQSKPDNSVVTLWWGRRPRICTHNPQGNRTQRRPEYRCQANTAWFLPWFYPFLDIYCWTSLFRDSVSLSVRWMRSLSIFLIELSCELKLNCSEQILAHKQWSVQVSHHYSPLWNSSKYKLVTSNSSGTNVHPTLQNNFLLLSYINRINHKGSCFTLRVSLTPNMHPPFCREARPWCTSY